LDAAERERLRGRPLRIDYRLHPPPPVSDGSRPAVWPSAPELVPTPAPEPPSEAGPEAESMQPVLRDSSWRDPGPESPSISNPWYRLDDAVFGDVSRVQPAGYSSEEETALPGSSPASSPIRRLPPVDR
jgi:hypothetical protein